METFWLLKSLIIFLFPLQIFSFNKSNCTTLHETLTDGNKRKDTLQTYFETSVTTFNPNYKRIQRYGIGYKPQNIAV